MSNKVYKEYMKKLKRGIPREFKEKQQFLISISADIESYIETHPVAVYEDICVEFGTPEEIVHSLMEDLDSNQIKDVFSKQNSLRKIIGVLSVILVVFLFLWFVAIPNIITEIETIIHEVEERE